MIKNARVGNASKMKDFILNIETLKQFSDLTPPLQYLNIETPKQFSGLTPNTN